jgi:hypothetical protein
VKFAPASAARKAGGRVIGHHTTSIELHAPRLKGGKGAEEDTHARCISLRGGQRARSARRARAIADREHACPGGCQLSSGTGRIEPFHQFNHPHPCPSPAAAGEGNFVDALPFSHCRERGGFRGSPPFSRCRRRGSFVDCAIRRQRRRNGATAGGRAITLRGRGTAAPAASPPTGCGSATRAGRRTPR